MTYCIMHDSEDTNGDGFCRVYATAKPQMRDRLPTCVTDPEGRAKRVKGVRELMKMDPVRELMGVLVMDALVESLDEYIHLLERMGTETMKRAEREANPPMVVAGPRQGETVVGKQMHASWCEEGPNHPGECKP